MPPSMSSSQPANPPATEPFTAAQRATLDALLDLVVPPDAPRGLPGASQVGVPTYVVAHAPEVLPALRRELDHLDREARERSGRPFADLGAQEREALVHAIREEVPGFMDRLAYETFACYYADARVLQAIGVEPRPPYPKGYEVARGDLTLLEPVRMRAKMFREA